jgi:REP element-mobilizing transposase RayT
MFFFTATINSWQRLLFNDEIKELLVESMKWLVDNNKAAIHAFVIMPNHIHLVWSQKDETYDLGGSFKSFTGSAIRKHLTSNYPEKLSDYASTQNDREFHFWERRSKNIEVMTRVIASQKVEYIHLNPLQEKWRLVDKEEDYLYSSAAYYLLDDDRFKFLSRYEEWI